MLSGCVEACGWLEIINLRVGVNPCPVQVQVLQSSKGNSFETLHQKDKRGATLPCVYEGRREKLKYKARQRKTYIELLVTAIRATSSLFSALTNRGTVNGLHHLPCVGFYPIAGFDSLQRHRPETVVLKLSP